MKDACVQDFKMFSLWLEMNFRAPSFVVFFVLGMISINEVLRNRKLCSLRKRDNIFVYYN
jgi:hypothetical protein